MITTTVPWIVWARFGQSTLRSSAIDSRDEAAAAPMLVLDGSDRGRRPAVAGCGAPPRGSFAPVSPAARRASRRCLRVSSAISASPGGPCGYRTSGSTS